MSEVRIIVDHMKIDYKGLFDSYELFKLIDAYLLFRGYEKKEDQNTEMVTPTGKRIEWEITHWKKITDYAKTFIKVRIIILDLNKVEVVKDGKKAKIGHGKLLVYLDGYLEFDYEHKWENRPILIYLRTLFDKFIYRSYTESFEQRTTQDCMHLYYQMMDFLNMHQKHKIISKIPHFAIK